MTVGIDDLSLYTPGYYYPLEQLAHRHNIDPQKYLVGIGQEKMAVLPPDEDIVTMAANAAEPLLDEATRRSISTVILATESGIDQSKSAGLFVHKLLDLAPNTRVVEFKQACYGATAGIQLATALVRQRPHEKVLVIATDVARYQQNSEAECTQGAGAVAIIIAAQPRLLEIHPWQGRYSQDVMDFWRPNYSKLAFVDGKLSIDVYLQSLEHAWRHYREDGGLPLDELPWLCFHQPFTKMARKAFSVFERIEPQAAQRLGTRAIEHSQRYGRLIGNCYTASLYIALLSLLDHADEPLDGQHVGLFSYGSGSVGEFFSGTVVPGYQAHLRTAAHAELLASRLQPSHAQYVDWFYGDHHTGQADHKFSHQTRGRFRLERIDQHRRTYARVQDELPVLRAA